MSKKDALHSLHSDSPQEDESFLPFHTQVMANEDRNQRGEGQSSCCVQISKQKHKREFAEPSPPLDWFETSSFNGVISRDGPPFAVCADGAA